MVAHIEKRNLKRNDSIQGLRAIAFIAIFISHTGLADLGALGAWGVSVFFVMSGFLMMYNYFKRENTPSFGFSFTWGKIKKLYPLHIFTMLLAARYALTVSGDLPKTLLDVGIHTFLVQMWIPHTKYFSTLNGPSWYLCTSIFLYLCFPFVLKFFKKHMTVKKSYVWLIILFVLQTALTVCTFIWGNDDKEAWFSTKWLLYFFPPARFIDFSIGCGLGYLALFAHEKKVYKKSNNALTVLFEILVSALIVISVYIYTNQLGLLGSEAFKYSFLFIVTTVPLIWLVAVKKGFISKILSIKFLVKLGDLSPYTFLIHGVVLKYVSLLMFLIFNIECTVLNSFISFVLTVASAIIWINCEKFISKWYLNHKKPNK